MIAVLLTSVDGTLREQLVRMRDHHMKTRTSRLPAGVQEMKSLFGGPLDDAPLILLASLERVARKARTNSFAESSERLTSAACAPIPPKSIASPYQVRHQRESRTGCMSPCTQTWRAPRRSRQSQIPASDGLRRIQCTIERSARASGFAVILLVRALHRQQHGAIGMICHSLPLFALSHASLPSPFAVHPVPDGSNTRRSGG